MREGAWLLVFEMGCWMPIRRVDDGGCNVHHHSPLGAWRPYDTAHHTQFIRLWAIGAPALPIDVYTDIIQFGDFFSLTFGTRFLTATGATLNAYGVVRVVETVKQRNGGCLEATSSLYLTSTKSIFDGVNFELSNIQSFKARPTALTPNNQSRQWQR